MLKIGGYINIIIALSHIIGLIWAKKMFEITGIGKEMFEIAQTHFLLPYIITILVAIVFFIFGLYGLSADHKLRKLPFLKLGIFIISGIYIFRGLGELIAAPIQDKNEPLEMIYSIIALIIGLLFLVGGLKKWGLHKNI
ncbi:hypothetical protein [Aquimarina longa]|uniref:hypothetical protein n=1 Tax=Aquimarina longa TaxID=1080221 RepID=UPI0007812AE1|nr:hypothetical protein [Aquimarina longa]